MEKWLVVSQRWRTTDAAICNASHVGDNGVSFDPFCYIIDLNGTIVYRGGLGGPLYMEKLGAVLEGKVLQK